jgi:hypothetical protein
MCAFFYFLVPFCVSCFLDLYIVSLFMDVPCRMNWTNQKYTIQMVKRLFMRLNRGALSVELVSRSQPI